MNRLHAGHARARKAVSVVTVSALLATTLVTIGAGSAAAAGTITGTVFRDYNTNGQMDTAGGTGVAVDTGVAGVTVKGYDSTGALVGTATTAAAGTYSLAVSGEASSAIRVEFSGFPTGYQPSAKGTGASGVQGGTTVQFVTRTSTGVNLGIQVPEEHSQSNPPLVTPIQRAGLRTDSAVKDLPALTSIPWSAGYTNPNGQTAGTYPNRTTLATISQVGSVWGTAFQASTNSLYAAATLKRHSGMGPLGLGGIYRVTGVLGSDGNVATSGVAVTQWLNVQGKAIIGGGTVDVGSVGTDASRGISTPATPALDLEGFQKASKVGIGGVAVSTDQKTLYFVNLLDRNLYSIDISDPVAAATSPVIHKYDLGLSGGQRPWALTIYRGQIYVGYVDSGEALATPTSAAAAGLKMHVIRADESAPTVWSADLLNASLGYTKGTPTAGGSPTPTTNLTRWNTWTDNWSWTGNGVGITWYGDPAQIYPQPILSGLQFDDGGYLNLALSDRTGIQGGNRNYASNSSANVASNYYQPASSGDLLIAAPSAGAFAIESNGSAGTRGPSTTAGDGEGPGGGEFYQDANGLGAGDFHKEVTIGSVAHVYGVDEIAAVTYDPLAPVQVAGDNWFKPSTGEVKRGYTHTLPGTGTPARSPDGTFQKGGGLGDLETLSELAPTEIGNRVWLDADRDGIQDAGEAGIDGVTVQLLDSSSAVVGTAVTSGGGEYYFSTAVTEAAAGNGDNRGGGLVANGAFTVRVGKASDFTSGGPLDGLRLTTQDATLGSEAYVGESDAVDSDAVAGSGAIGVAWFPLITVGAATTAPGHINHTFDAGFSTPAPRDLALIKTIANAAPALGGNGGTITFNLTVTNQGNAGENVNGITLTDYVDTRYFAALGSAPPGGTTSGSHAYPYTWAITGAASATKPQVTVSGVLAPGESLTIPLTLTIQIGDVNGTGGVGDTADIAAAFASGLINDAEISLFDTDGNAANGDSSTGATYDRDSVPDTTDSDTFVTDDYTGGTAYANVSPTPAGYNSAADEDDHDRAVVPLWDLALIKTRSSGQAAYLTSSPPSTVNFDITVKNQGGAAAYLVHVKDSVGTGLALGSNSTQVVTSSASNSRTITYVGAGEFVVDQLNAGESVVFPIATTVATATQGTLVNTAEISQFDNDSNPGNGLPAWVVDFDSTPDSNPSNDAIQQNGVVFPIDSHNTIDNAPLHGVNPLDEDDHDSEGVSFAQMRIGSTVYIDANGNLVGDGTGEGVAGVRVELRDSTGTVIGQTFTDANGDYFFAGLYPGDYTVGIPTNQTGAPSPTALAGYEPVPGAVTNPEALNFDNDGAASTGWLALSDTVTLTYGSEPADQVGDGARANVAVGAYPAGASNLNIDFVFRQRLYELGDLVWFDANNNGVANSGEATASGVTVQLYRDNGNGTFEPGGLDGSPVATAVTVGGLYRFTSLPAGNYFVHIAPQSALNGVGTSGTPSATPDNNVDNDNNAVSDATYGGWTSGPVTLGEGDASSEPTGEHDGTTGADSEAAASVADNRSNQTVDFGFVQRVRIGNQVWRDESDSDPSTVGPGDNNGTFDAANGEVGLTGVTVELWKDDGDGVFEPGAGDTLTASTVTDAEGNYWFEEVVPGADYFVAIQSIPSGFATARSSSGQSANPVSNDNADDGAAAAGYLSVSKAFAATLAGAPTGETDSVPVGQDAEAEANAAGSTYDDNDSNLRIDFGFVDVPLYRIGDLVWFENTPDGTANTTDVGLDGVLVQLLDSGGTVIAETATDATGHYSFENLVAGDYRVRIPGSQVELLGGGLTLTPGVLHGLKETVQSGNPDPDLNPTDNDNNGVVSGNDWQSTLVTLGGAFDGSFATEPVGETDRAGGPVEDLGWTNGPDNRSDFTVDFGFYPIMRLGDTVWLDNGGAPYAAANEDNGVYNASESPIANVDVNLYTDDGDGVFEPGADDALAGTTTTDAQGEYFFDALDGVHYWVAIPSTQVTDFAVLDGLRSSTGQAANDLTDNRDQGAPATGFAAVSKLEVMSYGTMSNGDTAAEPNADAKTGETIADANSNLAIDFGFSPAPRYAIGNLVWKDLNNDGVADSGEQGFPNVTVNLYLDNGDNVFTPGGDGPAIATTTTGPDGRYLFENLDAGTYFVMIPAQAAINDWFPAGTPDATANDDQDNNNDGVPDAYSGYTSGPVVLGNGNDHAEPTLETDGTTGLSAETPVSIRDDRSNQSVDFAFFPGLRLGNVVWHDESDSSLGTVVATDNNGVVDAGESVMPGVPVLLFRDGGDGTFDAAHGDDAYIGSTTTDAEGNYWFEHLAPGDYWAAIQSLPGTFGAMQSSDGRNAAGAVADNNDNGVTAYDGSVDTYVSVSNMIALAAGAGPTGEADALPAADGLAETEANAATEPVPDASSDLTVDFGFILTPLYRVGNLVWQDLNRDGIAENGEPGVAGVLVQLLDSADTVVAETVTDGAGKYAFEDLAAGDYRVRIPHAQTETLGGGLTIDATALDNLVSTTDAGTPDTDADDNDDNGILAAGDWVSGPVTLGAASGPYGTEPTSETLRDGVATDDDSGWANGTDAYSNFTVDFGFYPGLRLGDTVWLDNGGSTYVAANEDNGVLDATEPVIPGVDVTLFADDGDGVFEPGTDDTLIASTETDAQGQYFFTGLDESVSYWVAIPDAAGQNGSELDNLRSSAGQSADGTGTNDHDHGAPTAGYLGVSPLITLARGGMAYGESADEANADAKTGLTLGDGDSNLVVDFGFSPAPTYEIGNLVWLDANDNGVADSGEAGIPGVTVQLFKDDGSPAFEPGGAEPDGAAIATAITGADGRYDFTRLAAGDYWVFVPQQGPLEGLASSQVREANAGNDVDNDNNGIEFSYVASTGWAASLVTVGEGNDHQEPTLEADGTTGSTAEDGSPRDDRANQTIDFGFAERGRIGNQVWRDESDGNPATTAATDNNGKFDAGSGEVGIAGVTVELWYDTSHDGFQGPASDDALLDTTTTDSEGNYWFAGLKPDGHYFVAIQNVGSPFATTPRSSAGQGVTPTTLDNDDDGAPLAGYLAVSKELTVVIGAAPTGENDAVPAENAEAEANAATRTFADANSDLEVDFGFVDVPLYRIGNLVWRDANNDGIAEAGETGIAGVLVQLVDGANAVIAETVTDSSGHYSFANLAAGTYSVRIPGGQTEALGGGLPIAAGALDNLASSTTDQANADGNVNNDDNGVASGSDWESGAVTLGAGADAAIGTEPTGEVDRSSSATVEDVGWAGGPDDRSNFTVDFGFYELLRLGNWVWLDDGGSAYVQANEDNGVFDFSSGEAGIAGVDVNLYADDGDGTFEPGGDDALVGTTVTDTHGHYYFTGLTEGGYWAAIPDSQAELSGLRSSTGQAANDLTDSLDQGAPLGAFASVSRLIAMGAGATATGEGAWESLADVETGFAVADASSHLTIDFGFSPTPEYALGNLVWQDYNNDGVADSGEPGIPGLTVDLYLDNGDGALTAADGSPIATTTTGADGRYLFEALAIGSYIVHIPAQTGVTGWTSSGTPVGNADGGADNDNNGMVDAGNGGWTAGAVSLGEGDDNSEPTGETDGTTGISAETPVSVRDDRSNQTVDFGFWQGLRLGNQVWLDEGAGAHENNGTYDADETAITGVDVQLWLDGGDGTFDAGSGDDTLVGTTSTSGTGRYYFDHLAEGSYWAAVPSISGGGVLSSTNTAGPSLALDGEDDGAPSGAYLSVSPLYALTIGGAPTGELDGPGVTTDDAEAAANAATGAYRDEDSYLTVDFGFINVPLYRIGNLVWFDTNNDGIAQSGEPGIPGVIVTLVDNTTNTTIATTTTDAGGKYQFDNLAGGGYHVVILKDQSAGSDALSGFLGSSASTLTTDANVDNDNDGADGGAQWASGAVTLGGANPDSEPTDEILRADDVTDDDAGLASPRIDDDRSNLTVDFGFYSLSLGNHVFEDLNNNGIFEPGLGDAGIDGVTVQLWQGATLVATQVTAGGGLYLFTGLVDGATYTVVLPKSNFASVGALDGFWSSTGDAGDADLVVTDELDRGVDLAAGSFGDIAAAPVTVSAGGEPTTDGLAPNPDNDAIRPTANENLVLDFGFVRLELGGNVFHDFGNATSALNNNGLNDGDGSFSGVTLLLYNGDGTPYLRADGSQATATTDVNGNYLFTGLPEGTFIVEIPASNFAGTQPLRNLGSSDGNDAAPNVAPGPDNDVSGEDNGNPMTGNLFDGGAVRSGVVTLTAAGEPSGDTPPSAGTPDSNSNRTVDFGFWIVQDLLELGNQLWFDTNKDGIYDRGVEAPAPAGVRIELWDATTNTLYAVTFTDGAGHYLFSGLPTGDYYLVLPASDFVVGGPLFGYHATTGAGASANPDNGLDDDSNGADAADGVRSAVLSLVASMPTLEPEGYYTVADDRLSDLTLDVGLVELVLAETGMDAEAPLKWMAWFLGLGLTLILGSWAIRRTEED